MISQAYEYSGIGWVVLYQDTESERLTNFWVNEHDVSHPAGCMLLLIMDVFEHAFMIDYDLKRAEYIEAFMKSINRSTVEHRIELFVRAIPKAV